jgi:hypothetical protein
MVNSWLNVAILKSVFLESVLLESVVLEDQRPKETSTFIAVTVKMRDSQIGWIDQPDDVITSGRAALALPVMMPYG